MVALLDPLNLYALVAEIAKHRRTPIVRRYFMLVEGRVVDDVRDSTIGLDLGCDRLEVVPHIVVVLVYVAREQWTVLPTVLPNELANRRHGFVNGSFRFRLPSVELARSGAPSSSDSSPVEVTSIT